MTSCVWFADTQAARLQGNSTFRDISSENAICKRILQRFIFMVITPMRVYTLGGTSTENCFTTQFLFPTLVPWLYDVCTRGSIRLAIQCVNGNILSRNGTGESSLNNTQVSSTHSFMAAVSEIRCPRRHTPFHELK